MIVSGAAAVEDLIPGSPFAIDAVIENVGSGINPARQIAGAWQLMTIPGWEGRGGDAWRAFTPREAAHLSAVAPALNRVAAAMFRYQGVFRTARAEAQAAIDDAKAAERATATAQQEHQEAVRKAATAGPGTPRAVVAAFTDPGVNRLANAQARLDAARAMLARVGEEVAAEIRAAAATMSGVSPALTSASLRSVPAIHLPPSATEPNVDVMNTVGEFLTGFVGEAWDTVLGLVELLPIVQLPQLLEIFTPEGWEREARKREAFLKDPGGVLAELGEQLWKDLTYADLWENHPGQASGRVTFAALTILLPLAKLGKLGKLGKASELGTVGGLRRITDPSAFLKPKIDPSAPGGSLFPRDYDPLGGLTKEEFLKKYWDPDKVDWNGDRGGWRYPPDDGFDLRPGVPGPLTVKDMPVGTTFDRFGDARGAFVSPEGTSFPERALPPQSAEFDYHVYELARPFDEASGFPVKGTVARAFGQPGGGAQLMLPQKIEWLLEHGYVEEIVK